MAAIRLWTAGMRLLGVLSQAQAEEYTKSYSISGRAAVRVLVDDSRVRVVTSDTQQVDFHMSHEASSRLALGNALKINSHQDGARVDLAAVNGTVTVHSTDGAINASQLTGRIELQSVDGAINADAFKGDVNLHSTDGAINVTHFDGQCDVSSTDGARQWGVTGCTRSVAALPPGPLQ